MSKKIEKTFVVAVPQARAWHAFVDSHERSQWEADPYEIDPRPGGAVRWQLPGIETTGVVEQVDAPRLLVQRDLTGPHAGAEVTVTFEAVADGTRITITHAGFGEGEGWDEWLEGTTVGWSQAIADLIAYLETGAAPRRFFTAMRNPGMRVVETPAGIEVEHVQPGAMADQAGLRRGDLVLRLRSVPVYSIPELWVLMREHHAGTSFDIEYIRDGEIQRGTGALTDATFQPEAAP